MNKRTRVVICGAAGRDFHNFNRVYRDDPSVDVVAFTATQIPGIGDRVYPPSLAGEHYPRGIPIRAEDELETIVAQHEVDKVVFAYSDVDNQYVMRMAARVLATGADFLLLGPRATMLKSTLPVIAVCAVRTGCGKSQIARFLSKNLSERGLRPAVIRHPMPYGNLEQQSVQRFDTIAALDAANCTLEEREEYEPHIALGGVVYAGVDYEAILRQAEADADIIIWDGGNNDFSFVQPDLSIAVVDALRPDQLDTHYPGATVLRMADLVVVNKVDAATADQRQRVGAELARLTPDIPIIYAASPVSLDNPEMVVGKRVLIVEDGPTITHGGMPHGAGYHATLALDGTSIVDPRAAAPAEITEVYDRYPHIGRVLPAMGYSDQQLTQLAATIEASDADVVVAGTPIDLARALDVSIPVVRAHYRYQDDGEPGLMIFIEQFLEHHRA